MKQLPLSISERPAPSFDNFLPGANEQAWACLQALPSGGTPVLLWGPHGSGKTHLLQATASRLREDGRTAGAFDAAADLPWEFDEGWSAVFLDDCDRFDADRQHAAFRLFVEAASHGIPILAASSVPPVDLPVRDDLRTRLGWGLVFQMAPLAESEARAVLRRQADQRGVLLTDEAMDYLMTRFTRDLGHLIGVIDRLDTFALAHQRGALTIPLIRQMLAEDAT